MRRIFLASLAVWLVALPLVAAARDAEESSVTVADAAEAPGKFEQVGHEPLGNRGMNAALAVHGDYAYIGSRTDGPKPSTGIAVVDISKPKAPEMIGEIGPPEEGNEGETSREMRVLRSQDLLIVMNLGSNCSYLIHYCSPRSVQDNYRFYDIRGKRGANPKLVAEYEPSVNPHEFFLWQDPKRPKRVLMFQSTPGGGTSLLVTDISKARKGKFTEIGKYAFPGFADRLHSMSVTNDGKLTYVAHLQGGFFVIDTSQIAANRKNPKVRVLTTPDNAPKWAGPGAHSAVKLFGSKYALVADEVYGDALKALGDHGCPWGWVRMIDARKAAKPKVVAQYKLPQNKQDFCTTDPPRPSSSYSAHNPTLTKNLVLITWHSGGLQAIDVSKPRKPRQAAEFLPEPLPAVFYEDPALSAGQDKVVMWSFPIVKDGLIYVVDLRNGLYVLRYKGPHAKEISRTRFLEGNSNLGDALRFERP